MKQTPDAIAKSPELLVSIRSAKEAEIAKTAKVAWIDLKEPNNGALGAPTIKAAKEVVSVLQSHSKRSVALGELESLNIETAFELAPLFPLAKVGLSAMASSNWQKQLDALSLSMREAGARLVPVIYADWRQCGAPNPTDVLEYAARAACHFLLIDTFLKNGNSVADLSDFASLEELIGQCSKHQIKVVLAGSLQLEQASHFAKSLPIAAIGVRGGVCQQSRDSDICPSKLAIWQQALANGIPK